MQRGLMALKEYQWQREQYALGVYHGLKGHQGIYSDQFYQKGFRRGCERRKKAAAKKADG